MSVRVGQARLNELARQLHQNIALSDDDKNFLVGALLKIADGNDAEVALNVKAKKGERKSKNTQNRVFLKEPINAAIKCLIDPVDEGGHGMSLKEAVVWIKTRWTKVLPSEETMLRNWNDVRKTQKRDFKRNDQLFKLTD